MYQQCVQHDISEAACSIDVIAIAEKAENNEAIEASVPVED